MFPCCRSLPNVPIAPHSPHCCLAQDAGTAAAAASEQLAAADRGDKEGLHRLAWLAEQRPLVEQRLAAVHGRVAGPAATAVVALQALAERIEGEFCLTLVKPPLAEVESQRDAAVAALTGALDLSALVRLRLFWICCARQAHVHALLDWRWGCLWQAGAALAGCLTPAERPHVCNHSHSPTIGHPFMLSIAPAICLHLQTPASSARDVRGEVRRLLDEALSLPEMPGYVNYEPVQRDIQQWIDALRGAAADVDGARQVGTGRHAVNRLGREALLCLAVHSNRLPARACT